jgi:hypothetical protein
MSILRLLKAATPLVVDIVVTPDRLAPETPVPDLIDRVTGTVATDVTLFP